MDRRTNQTEPDRFKAVHFLTKVENLLSDDKLTAAKRMRTKFALWTNQLESRCKFYGILDDAGFAISEYIECN